MIATEIIASDRAQKSKGTRERNVERTDANDDATATWRAPTSYIHLVDFHTYLHPAA